MQMTAEKGKVERNRLGTNRDDKEAVGTETNAKLGKSKCRNEAIEKAFHYMHIVGKRIILGEIFLHLIYLYMEGEMGYESECTSSKF